MNRRFVRAIVVLGFLSGVLAFATTGLVAVAPGEAVVVRRLGRIMPQPYGPGPHWGLPIGLDRLTRIRTDEVRRLDVGLAGAPGPDDDPGAGEYLTGDLNLMRARGVVQYTVSDPFAFATAAADLDRLLPRLAEASLTRALARRGIDDILRADRAAVARDAEADFARVVGELDLGISVLGLSLTDARPPSEVAPDFAAAEAAQSDHDRRLYEARAYAAASLPAANATAQARRDQARARADRAVAMAGSRASRFVALFEEAERSRSLTVRRLYLDALRDILPRVRRKLVLDQDSSTDLNLIGAER